MERGYVMAIQDIIHKIELETQTKIKEILSSAKEEERNILANAESEAKKIKEKMLKNGEEELAEKKRRQLTASTLEARRMLLEEKQKIVSEVYEEVQKKLENLSPNEYQKLIRKLILEAANGGEEVIIAEKDKSKISPDFLKDLNRELAKKGKKPLLFSPVTQNISGGFILRSGKLEINSSFPALLKSLREKTEFQVIRELFSNGSTMKGSP